MESDIFQPILPRIIWFTRNFLGNSKKRILLRNSFQTSWTRIKSKNSKYGHRSEKINWISFTLRRFKMNMVLVLLFRLTVPKNFSETHHSSRFQWAFSCYICTKTQLDSREGKNSNMKKNLNRIVFQRFFAFYIRNGAK